MPLHPLNSRQVANTLALNNIGSPAGDTLNDILSRIDSSLAGLTNANGYIARETALSLNATNLVVNIPQQPDTSYIVLAVLENLVDANPQMQQVEVTSKSTTSYTLSWNHPLDSNNYKMSYIIPFKQFFYTEQGFSSASNSLSYSFPFPEATSTYPVIGSYQNIVDATPEFQTPIISSKSTSAVTMQVNSNTDSANYQGAFFIEANCSTAVSSGVKSATINLPINYNTASYGVALSVTNLVDGLPQYQPMIITSKSNSSFVVSWSDNTDSANYMINAYVVSLTP